MIQGDTLRLELATHYKNAINLAQREMQGFIQDFLSAGGNPN